jgi:quercetin dioxygenase-like cupin family protein
MNVNSDKNVRVELDKEEKVIRLGSYFYNLKGVLIKKATDEEKKKCYCYDYMTYPIVDDDWMVRNDDCIADGIERLIIGKKGNVVPLRALKDALDDNANEYNCSYSDVLVNLERHGITISNRVAYNSKEELSDTIVLEIGKVAIGGYRIDSHYQSYYIPRRFCVVGKDDELYHLINNWGSNEDKMGSNIIDIIAEDVYAISWFFNKPNLKVLCVAITESGFGFMPNKDADIPKDWFYTLQTLDNDINRKVEELHKEYPGFYEDKLPDHLSAYMCEENLTFLKNIQWQEVGDGVKRQVLGYDKNLMMVKVAFEKGAEGMPHSHPHTQSSYIVSGRFEVMIDGKTKVLTAGDGYHVAPNLLHGCVCLDEGMLIDTLTPLCTDFLK